MDSQLDTPDCPHFALLYIDDDGKLRFEASASIADNCHRILSSEVIDSFLRAVSLSGDRVKSLDSSGFIEGQSKSPPSPGSTGSPCHSRRSSFSQQMDTQMKRKKVTHEYVIPFSINCYPKTMLLVKNHALLRKYYERAFQSLKQANCRILAKAYIKLVEPRKQVNFPYNGRKVISGIPQQLDPETTKPPWWPTEVVHREPDHLLKAGRVHLLVHILCELRESHGISVEKLREADQSIRRQFSPPECLQVLDEIYRVRGEEESYLDGRTDDQAVVCVSQVPLQDSQTWLYSPSGSSNEFDTLHRDEMRDLESHTSVFPSSNGTPTSPTEVEEPSPPPVTSTAPTSWNACPSTLPASLPPANSTMKPLAPDTASSPYTLDFTPSYGDNTTLGMPPFAMGYYPNPQFQQNSVLSQDSLHPQPSVPAIRPPGTGFGGFPQPYYYTY
ncbi:hypothetical protein ASPCAL01719 [Aspergillus calidoustus]|uniref:Subtelomeric hrmA-associated cluster protein AFUB-079030/YDR124W-like helical bundle domain-containing protein n=1 Tax=Aspergillus calidoustus TaxID=454130 RepID=A0A0U5GJQ2_ASPCI|nr:hypothetical protein ASPCAL01719 [Aspergillus calidoustus]